MRKYCLSIISVVLALASCQSKDDLMQSPIQDGNTVLSVSDKDLLCTGESITVAFTSDSQWTLLGCPDWLEVNKKSGRRGTTTIKMAAKCNDSRAERVANLTFKAQDGSFSTPMKVTQGYPYLNITTDTLSFNWNDCRTEREGVVIDNNPQTIGISSNVAWRIEKVSETKSGVVDYDHFTFSADAGEMDYELEVIPIRDNYNKSPYDAVFRLYPVMLDEDGNEVLIPEKAADSYLLKVHQKNLRFLINDSPDDAYVEISELNDDIDLNLEIDSEVSWTVADAPDWLVMSNEQGRELVSVNFKADGANPTLQAREGVVRLVTEVGANRDIHVVQKPYVFEFTPLFLASTDLHFANEDANVYSFKLETTGTWEVTDIPDWITVTPSLCDKTTPQSGNREHVISISTTEQNLSLEDCLGMISIRSTMNELYESVSVKQDKFVFDVIPDKTLADLPTMNTLKYSVQITSSGRWEIVDKPDWIDVSLPSSDKGTFDISVGAANGNPDITKDREAVLTVVSTLHRDAGMTLERTIPVKQRKYTFEVTPTDDVDLLAYKTIFSPFVTRVACSADWVLAECPQWLMPSVTGGDGIEDVDIVFTPTANIDKEDRLGNVVIKSLYNGAEKTFAVRQEAFVFDNRSISFDVAVMNDLSFPVSFDLTSEAGWVISQYSPWLNPSSESGTGTSSIAFRPTPNPELVEREGTAVIHSVVSGEDKVISFTQEKYVFDSTAESFAYTELEQTLNEISIVSSGPWVISDAPSWMNLSSNMGSGSRTIYISPDKNLRQETRNCTFHVVSTLNNLTKAVTVAQDAFQFDDSSESYAYTTLEERTDTFAVLCSGKWKAKDVPSWITLSQLSGDGSEAGEKVPVYVTSQKNLTESDRSAVFRIVSADAGFTKEIALMQDKFDFRIGNSKFEYSDPLDTGSMPLSIICPAEWTISSNQPWLTVSVAEGTGDSEVVLTPERNLTESPRTATVTVTSTLNSLKRTVTVTQPKFVFDVHKLSHSFESPIGSHNPALTVKVDCSSGWEAAASADWVEVVSGNGSGNGSFDVKVKTNPNTTSRSAKIIVTSVLNGLTREIAITQKPYVFDATSESLTFDACELASQQVDVVCSGSWTISNTASDWLTASASSSSGNGYVTLLPKYNSAEKDREAVVTVTSADNPALVKKITVVQKKHTLDVSKTSMEFAPAPAGSDGFNVVTSGPWTVKSDKTWCNVSQTTQTGTGSVLVSVDVNNTLSDRTAVLTISCDNTTLKKTVTVTQSKYVFDRTTENLTFAACDAQPAVVNVTSSGRWNVVSSQSWATVSQSTANGNGTVTVNCDANPSSTIRTAVITVTCLDNSSWKKVINVTQSGHEMLLSDTSLDFETIPTDQKEVTVTTLGPWTAESNQPWCKVAQSTTDGPGKITVSASLNPDLTQRTAVITISCKNSSLKKTITVKQDKYVFDQTGLSTIVNSCPPRTYAFDVVCLGRWSVESDQTWAKPSQSVASGNGRVTVALDANPLSAIRIARVTVRSLDNSSLVKVVEIMQNAHQMELSSQSLTFDALASSDQSVSVTTTGPWSVRSDKSWCIVEKIGEDGSGTVKISVMPNMTLEDRTANVTIACSNSTFQKVIKVTQDKYTFEVLQESMTVDACPAKEYVVEVRCLGGWSVSCDQTWLGITTEMTGGGNGRIIITPAVSSLAASRQAVITVTCEDNPTLKKAINVTQTPHGKMVDVVNMNFNASSASRTFSIRSSGTWTVSSDRTWCNVSVTAGRGNAAITVTLSDNDAADERTATITIKCDECNLVETILVKQAGITENVTPGL